MSVAAPDSAQTDPEFPANTISEFIALAKANRTS
jgi:hypothetical protein